MAFFHLRAFAEQICSEYLLPGTTLCTDPETCTTVPDALTISHGDALLSREWRRSGSYALGLEGLSIDVTGVGRFLCSETGSCINVAPALGVPDEEITTHLIANAIPAALWMRGHRLIHAGAAVPAGEQKAVAIAGPSMSGKSTVLMNLLRAGASIVSEDVSSVVCNQDKCILTGFSAQILLRHSGQAAQERTAVLVPESHRQASAPAGAIVVLDTEDASACLPQRLSGSAALQAVLKNRYRQVVPGLVGREPADFPSWVSVATLVPVYSWNPVLTKQEHWSSVLAALLQ